MLTLQQSQPRTLPMHTRMHAHTMHLLAVLAHAAAEAKTDLRCREPRATLGHRKSSSTSALRMANTGLARIQAFQVETNVQQVWGTVDSSRCVPPPHNPRRSLESMLGFSPLGAPRPAAPAKGWLAGPIALLFGLLLLGPCAQVQAAAHCPVEQPIATGSELVHDLDAFMFWPAVKDGRVWFVELYTDGCRACKRLAPDWAQLAEAVEDRPEIAIGRWASSQPGARVAIACGRLP